jgi:hypothetical protein
VRCRSEWMVADSYTDPNLSWGRSPGPELSGPGAQSDRLPVHKCQESGLLPVKSSSTDAQQRSRLERLWSTIGFSPTRTEPTDMRHHQISADVPCPACGKPGLTFARVTINADAYSCPSCRKRVLHIRDGRRVEGKGRCGLRVVLDGARIGPLRSCDGVKCPSPDSNPCPWRSSTRTDLN